MKNTIELTLEQAKDVDTWAVPEWFKTKLETSFPELRPKKITDLVTDADSAVNYINTVLRTDSCNPFNEDKRWSAFMRLSRLAFVLNEGWGPDWEDINEYKFSVCYNGESGTLSESVDTIVQFGLIYFKSSELCLHALRHNEQLFKDLFKVK